MNYEAWRISYQSSEQAARAAFAEWQKRPAECEPVGLNKTIRDSVDRLLAQAGYSEDSSVRHQLACMNFTAPQPCPNCLKWATDMSQVTKTLRYIIGIAERGTATTLPDGVTVESFVLDYVKGLEAKVAELTKERDEEQIVGDKLFAKLTRAESVIEKVYKFINSPISMDSCLQMNVAIKEYHEGKKS